MSPNGGIATRSTRALRHVLNRDAGMAASELGWLEDGQLDRLILACHQLADAAAAERRGREVHRDH